MAIARGHGHQKLPIARAMAAEDSLATDEGDRGARIDRGQPPLPGLFRAGPRVGTAEIELDALIVCFAEVDSLQHRTVAFKLPCGIHIGEKVQLVIRET